MNTPMTSIALLSKPRNSAPTATPAASAEAPSDRTRLPARELDDAALVQRLLEGNDAAWNELLRRHGPTMKRCITSVTSRFRAVASDEDEKDIYSTICLRLVQDGGRRLAAFDPDRGCSLGAWLGTIAVRTTYDFLRKNKRNCKRTPETVLETLSCPSPDPYDRLLGAERTAHFHAWMRKMNARDRKFLEQVCEDTIDPQTIAADMGISVATVYSKKHKLIARLNRVACQEPASAAA